MGVLAVAQMGRCMGEVAYKVSDSTFLWCNALLRRLLCATVIRHCTVHTGRNLTAITASEQTMAAYLQNSFFSAGYLMAASIVALKCLNLVPDLAAWMIPEGDTAFSTRNFGEGVAQQAKMTATGGIGSMMR